jgi:hypothetical protein
MRFSRAVVIAAVLIAPPGLNAQRLHGRVLDAQTRAPLAGVELKLLQGDRALAVTVSDSGGRYSVQAPGRGRFRLAGARIGYADALSEYVELGVDAIVAADLMMSSTPVKVTPLILDAPRDSYLQSHGFYERQAVGVGDFMTGEQIVRRNPQTVSDLLRGLRGIKIQRVNFNNEVYFAGANCYPAIVVDGQTLRWGGRTLGAAGAVPLDDLVRIGHIDAIEAYRGGSGAPAEFMGPNAGCGVILIWTRHK